jgi:hypothetical protein
MQIAAPDLHILRVANPMIGKSALPNREVRRQAMRKAALNKTYCSLYCDALRRNDEMDVIRHNNERVKLIVALAAIVLQGFKKEFGVCRNLKQPATIVGRGSNKERAKAWCSSRNRATRRVPRVRPVLLKGTASAVP